MNNAKLLSGLSTGVGDMSVPLRSLVIVTPRKRVESATGTAVLST